MCCSNSAKCCSVFVFYGSPIPQVDRYRDLGLAITANLNFSYHITKVVQSCSRIAKRNLRCFIIEKTWRWLESGKSAKLEGSRIPASRTQINLVSRNSLFPVASCLQKASKRLRALLRVRALRLTLTQFSHWFSPMAASHRNWSQCFLNRRENSHNVPWIRHRTSWWKVTRHTSWRKSIWWASFRSVYLHQISSS